MSDATKLWESKCLHVYENEIEEEQHLNKYQGKGDKYVLFFLCPQKESNRLINLSNRKTNLNHLVYIPKLLYQIIANFLLEFLGKKNLKAQKNLY